MHFYAGLIDFQIARSSNGAPDQIYEFELFGLFSKYIGEFIAPTVPRPRPDLPGGALSILCM